LRWAGKIGLPEIGDNLANRHYIYAKIGEVMPEFKKGEPQRAVAAAGIMLAQNPACSPEIPISRNPDR
jgi:hypothetical protein